MHNGVHISFKLSLIQYNGNLRQDYVNVHTSNDPANGRHIFKQDRFSLRNENLN